MDLKFHKFIKIFHTVKYLQAKQIYYRLYYYLRFLSLAKPLPHHIRAWLGSWQGPLCSLSHLGLDGVFTILGEQGTVFNNSSIWHDDNYSKLWLYNLHYLDELNSVNADQRIEINNNLIDQWIVHNPPLKGIGWEPYPLSLRLVNLVKWCMRSGFPIPNHWLLSMNLQAQALAKQIEYHILANHLFANGKALIFIGSYLTGPQADLWLKRGLKILDKEIEEQFLADGGHFELSPMYQAILLWDLCDLVNLANCSGLLELKARKMKWQQLIIKAWQWLLCMSHPDHELAFFNDATFGIAPSLENIKNYCLALQINLPVIAEDRFAINLLPESGYCSVYLGAGSKAIIDVAKIGPDYQPGHAHADTLSFELSLNNQRFLVNSGISQYGTKKERQFQRSTKAHNTVTIDNIDSSEVWSGFRVGRRAYPMHLVVEEKQDCLIISCGHTGYLRLPNKNIHYRRWKFLPDSLVINDEIIGNYTEAEARFYFHPDVQLTKADTQIHCLLLDKSIVNITTKGAGDILIKSALWFPSFGVSVANSCLIIKFVGQRLITQIEW